MDIVETNMENLPYGILLESVKEHKKENVRRQRQTIPANWPFKKLDSKEPHVAPKGSLVVSISQDKSGANYRTLSKPNFLLSCKPDEVYKLNSVEKDLLEGVEHFQDRTESLHKLDWVQKLRIGSPVYVVISSKPIPVQGIIQYIGIPRGKIGTKIFVEAMVCRLLALCTYHMNRQLNVSLSLVLFPANMFMYLI